MKTRNTCLAVLALCALSSTATAAPDSGPLISRLAACIGSPLRFFGLTDDQRLVCFTQQTARPVLGIGDLTGFTGSDTALVGIDFRVQDGLLYGVGNGGGVYTINLRTAGMTLVNALSVPLSGNSFGVDFNPAADRLRIISDTGQNLRHNVADLDGGATLADSSLNYLVGSPPVVTTALGVTASAYTNNDLDPNTATTLFNIDSTLDQVVIQSPPNAGTLFPTGKLRVDTAATVGFDIRSTRGLEAGSVLNFGYATLSDADGNTAFYLIDLLTGQAFRKGRFSVRNRVIDLAAPLAFNPAP
ncbi:MAG: DUF4394 domain-containing protein [Panacagrimonas sp.]